jgi:peptide deformylase
MTVRDILILPDKRLRLVSKPVAKIDAATKQARRGHVRDHVRRPWHRAFAAIQIGEPRRIVTMDLAKKDEPKEPQVFINPELISKSGDKNTHEEGCLSIPEYYEEVERPAAVRFRYLDLDGNSTRSSLRDCWRRASSTRSIISTACCSSITFQAQARPRHQEIHQGGKTRQAGDQKRGGLSMPLRLIFMGTPDFSVPTLLALAGQGHDIAAVYTRAAKPGGRRGLELVPSPVEREAERSALPCIRRRR